VVLVKTGEAFEAPDGVMQLVAEAPEERRFMTKAVPPVVNEGGDDVADGRAGEI